METEILLPTTENLNKCAKLLQSGEIVAFPTETVYGLGGNAFDENAVKKIYEAKGRPSDNPLIVHIGHLSMLDKIADNVSLQAQLLIKKFMPGALTLVFKKKAVIPNAVTGGLDSVAVRMPNHPAALTLIRKAGVPVCAPSANTSSKPSPTVARHVYDDLKGKIPAIIDGGECRIGVESTVIDMTGDKPRLLRAGGIPLEKISEVVGDIEIVKNSEVALCPGMKYKHYAPKAEVLFSAYYDEMSKTIAAQYDALEQGGRRPVILCLSLNAALYGDRKKITVGDTYDDYAHNLYFDLRYADELKYDVIIAEGVADGGIGPTLINRLVKASGGQVI